MSRTLKRAHAIPAGDASRAEAAFTKVLPRLNAVPPADRVQPNVDLQDAGTAAIGILAQLASRELHARCENLAGAGEFRMAALDELAEHAWAAIHVRRKLLLKLGTGSEARIPPDIERRAREVRDRMAALCAYHFGDSPAYAATVAYLAQGTGYLDLANDLEGYADIYRAEHDAVSRDVKYYRPTDANDARELAQTIYNFLGVGSGGDEPDWGALQGAIWPQLTRVYDEVRRVGRFLGYYDDGETRFPSLVTAARSAPKPGAADKSPAPPAPAAAPAATDPKP
jgi:hypothetical protein